MFFCTSGKDFVLAIVLKALPACFFWDFGLGLWSRTISYAPGPYGPGPLIILKNFLSQICSRTIFEKHTAPGAYSKHASRAVCISNMVLEHIWLRKFFQIINGPGPYGPDYKSRPNLQKAIHAYHSSSQNVLNMNALNCQILNNLLFCVVSVV